MRRLPKKRLMQTEKLPFFWLFRQSLSGLEKKRNREIKRGKTLTLEQTEDFKRERERERKVCNPSQCEEEKVFAPENVFRLMVEGLKHFGPVVATTTKKHRLSAEKPDVPMLKLQT